jgi:hypothetical protein
MTSGKSTRVLDNHFSTQKQSNPIWLSTTKSGKILLTCTECVRYQNDLYFHALTGYSLYSVPTKVLANATNAEVEKSVKLVAKTAWWNDIRRKWYFIFCWFRKQQNYVPQTRWQYSLVEGEKSDGLTRLVSITTTCISPTLELMKLIFQIWLYFE